VLATASTPTDPYSTSTKRVVQSHNAHTVELFANHALLTSVVTAAAKRHIPRELVPTIVILRQTTVVAATVLVAPVL